eukprot:scaffold30969_cov47-Cyclotella_meneghiniana.AAC.1
MFFNNSLQSWIPSQISAVNPRSFRSLSPIFEGHADQISGAVKKSSSGAAFFCGTCRSSLCMLSLSKKSTHHHDCPSACRQELSPQHRPALGLFRDLMKCFSRATILHLELTFIQPVSPILLRVQVHLKHTFERSWLPINSVCDVA